MNDLPAFLQEVVAERIRTPYEPGHHSVRSEASRIAFLHYLERAHDQIAVLSDLLRTHPDDDEMADLVIDRLTLELNRAGVELDAFRTLRECEGQG